VGQETTTPIYSASLRANTARPGDTFDGLFAFAPGGSLPVANVASLQGEESAARQVFSMFHIR
jgi:hypothetical protein